MDNLGTQENSTANRSIGNCISSMVFVFAAYLVMVVFSIFAEGIYDVSFANMGLDITNSVMTLSLMYCAGYTVEFICSLYFGAYFDRHDPLRGVIFTSGVKVLLFLCIGLGSAYVQLKATGIICIAAVVDMANQVEWLAIFVLLPRLLPTHQLARLQGISGTLRSGMNLLSPMLSAVVLTFWHGTHALLAATIFQVISLICLLIFFAAARRFQSVDTGSGESLVTPDIKTERTPATRRSVAQFMLRKKGWKYFFIANLMTTLFLSCAVLMIIPLLRLHYGFSVQRCALFLTFCALGILIGEIINTVLAEKAIDQCLVISPLIVGISLLILATVNTHSYLLIMALIIFNCGFVIYLRSSSLVLQLRTAEKIRGTWAGINDGVGRIINALGILASGFICDYYGTSILYISLGILTLATGILWTRYYPYRNTLQQHNTHLRHEKSNKILN